MENSTTDTDVNCNGVSPGFTKTAIRNPAAKKSKASVLTLLATLRFSCECIASNIIVVGLVVALLPLLVVYNALKFLEQVIVRYARGLAVPVGGQDALWQQSSDKNRLIITCLLLSDVDGDTDSALARFRKAVLERMVNITDENGNLIYPRCRWFIRAGYFQYFFEEDENFSIDNHVFKWDGEIPSSKEALEDIVSKLSAEALPEGRSPWLFCCVPTNYGRKSMAVVFRMHHSMADGVSLSGFLAHQLPDNAAPQTEPRKFSSFGRTLMSIKAIFVTGRCLVKLLFSWSDRSLLHGRALSGIKRVAWSESLDLKRVKEIKNATGTTVNDVLMACLAGALRKYQQDRGVERPEDALASVPVDVRPSNKTLAFENNFAVVFLKLPVGVNGPVQQLMEMKSRMDEMKTSGEPLGMAWSMQLTVELFPNFLSKPLVSMFCDKATAVVSNVPGPQNSMSIGKSLATYMTFWPPQRDSIGVGVSIYSYGGQIQVGVQGDVSVLPEPQLIIKEFGQTLEELSKCTLEHTQTNGHRSDHAKEL